MWGARGQAGGGGLLLILASYLLAELQACEVEGVTAGGETYCKAYSRDVEVESKEVLLLIIRILLLSSFAP